MCVGTKIVTYGIFALVILKYLDIYRNFLSGTNIYDNDIFIPDSIKFTRKFDFFPDTVLP